MNFLCSTAVVYIRVSDTIKTHIFVSWSLFSFSLEFLSLCGMQRSQINAIKSTKSYPPLTGFIWRYMEFYMRSCGAKICKHAPLAQR